MFYFLSGTRHGNKSSIRHNVHWFECALIYRCERTFVHYQFPFKPAVETSRVLPHGSSVVWGESSTILLGTIAPELLLERLRGAPLTVELHDRDKRRKDRKEEEEEPARFGTMWGDDLLGTCAYNKGTYDVPLLSK